MRKRIIPEKTEKLILLCAAVIMIAGKHFLIMNLPIEARNYNTDDRLMVQMAASLLGGNWLGEYRGQLLMKGSFFPMFLAAVHRIGGNYLGTLNLINTLAVGFFVFQLRRLLKAPVLRFILFTVLLWDPCSFSRLSFQRVYRTSITEMQVLFLWGAYYGLYLKSSEAKDRIRVGEFLLILLAGFDLWAIWNTREECFWMLPFVGMATLLIIYRYWQAGKDKKCSGKFAALHIGMLLIPFLMLFAGNMIIQELNERKYGEPIRLELADGNYSKALASIYSVKNDHEIELVTVTREKLERIMTVSPSLQQIQPELEKNLQLYGSADRHPKDGETEDGWFLWALKYAAFDNGAADSLPKSQQFWNTVRQEVETALNDPSSALERQPVMPSALMSPLQKSYLKTLPEAFLNALHYIVTYKETEPLAGPSGKSNPNNDQLFMSITNNIAISDNEESMDLALKNLPHLSSSVKILNFVVNIYHIINPIASVCALICICILLFRIIAKKETELLPPVLIIFGMFFSMLVITAGVSYAHISAFIAIMYHYLSGAYPLMLGSIWLTILYLIQIISDRSKIVRQPAL